MLISGRIRLIREDPGLRPRVRVEEEVGRGEAVGAVWALTGGIHDTTALCVRDSELVRMSKVTTAHHAVSTRYNTSVPVEVCTSTGLLCSSWGVVGEGFLTMAYKPGRQLILACLATILCILEQYADLERLTLCPLLWYLHASG